MISFSFIASAIYILNDIVDRHIDRMHEKKKNRPLAAGQISVFSASLLMVFSLLVGLAIAWYLSVSFFEIALAYVFLQILYCFFFKNYAIIDVLSISLGFIFRIAAGAYLVSVPLTPWIIIATGLLALFQALAKRRDDLCLDLTATHRKSLNGYNKPFLDVAIIIVVSCLIVVYAIYTTDLAVLERLNVHNLYFTIPFVVAGVLRYLQITYVFAKSGSPTEILLKDRFVQLSVLGWIATFALLTHVSIP
jgi:4-hydroxybenzoate polyprenyltransferase